MKKEEKSETQENVNGDLQQCEEKLQDIYMQYKEKAKCCKLLIEDHKKDQDRVFYFKPDTILLKKPEEQRQFK